MSNEIPARHLDDFPLGALSPVYGCIGLLRMVVFVFPACRQSDRRDRAMRLVRGITSTAFYIVSMIFNALALSFLWAAERLEGDF